MRIILSAYVETIIVKSYIRYRGENSIIQGTFLLKRYVLGRLLLVGPTK